MALSYKERSNKNNSPVILRALLNSNTRRNELQVCNETSKLCYNYNPIP
jgi:hypothetical protein